MRAIEELSVSCPSPYTSFYLVFNQEICHTLTESFITCSIQGFSIFYCCYMINSKDAPPTTKTDLLINSWHFVLLQNTKAISDNGRMISNTYRAKYHIDLSSKLSLNNNRGIVYCIWSILLSNSGKKENTSVKLLWVSFPLVELDISADFPT